MPNAAGKVDLPALMRELAARGVNELHVEAGFKLNGSLLREDCVDELLIYMAPRLLGQGIGVCELAAPSQLSEARQLQFESVERLGDDLRVLARFSGRL
jgi:diaminohydroxyphosphoribosylaminopyrimidine deaminase/5-amino-6-(5-phosphoribosylamino)uracil reductase